MDDRGVIHVASLPSALCVFVAERPIHAGHIHLRNVWEWNEVFCRRDHRFLWKESWRLL